MSESRRSFIKKSGLTLAGVGIAGPLSSGLLAQKEKVAASDKVRVAVIGCNGMGFSNLNSFLKIPEVECVALCDADQRVLDRRVAEVEKMTGKQPKTYRDFRKLLENKDIDAVIIGTPDHWHCLMMVMACEAGKDVYVEKPLANTIQECRIMVKAAERYNRVVQVGMWQRSGRHWQDAMDYLWAGHIGKVRLVKTWAYQGWMKPVPILPDSAVPTGVDYDMWLGPAPLRPFNQNRFHFNFRWFWDYAGGLMTDWGVHIIDMALYGMKASVPNSVMASGGKFAYPDDASETPDTLQAIYEFDDFSMLWEHGTGIGLGPYGRDHGVAFIGNNGTLVVDRSGWELIPETERIDGQQMYKMPAIPPRTVNPNLRGLDQHTQNFIDCLASREKPTCHTEIGAHTAMVAHMGNIAFKTGQKISWDDATGTFTHNDAANRLIEAHYRSPWKLPSF